MAKLGLNVDHVATVRQARGGVEPDPVLAAYIGELAGAECITVHLREDRRHIQERDLYILRKTVKTKLNLEMASTTEMVNIALDLKPDQVTLVPEKREELTTEGGLDVISNFKNVSESVSKLQNAGIVVSLFVDPDISQLKSCKETKAKFVEIHTGSYAEAKTEEDIQKEFEKIKAAADFCKEIGIRVNAGHGLNYNNISLIKTIDLIEEYNIGHSIMARAIIVGMEKAVKEMVEFIR